MTLEILETVTSTMDTARQRVTSGQVTFAAAGRPSSDGILAYTQTAGRGQRGRSWYDRPGESLCATFYFHREALSPANAGAIAFLAGVAAAEAVEEDSRKDAKTRREHEEEEEAKGERRKAKEDSTPEQIQNLKSKIQNPRIGLKWPNDLILNEKKVGGILVEMAQTPAGEWAALIGVGVNLRVTEFPSEVAPFATSLAREGFAPAAPETLAERMAATLRRLGDLYAAQDFAAILNLWRERDKTAGLRYQTELAGSVVTGIAEGVSDEGALRLRLDDGRALDVISASSIQEISAARSPDHPPHD